MAESSPPLGKYLASSDKKTRDKAVKHLALFLSNPESDALSEFEIVKLWKGLFYCYWMSDKPLVQQGLAQELAELLLTITNTSSSLVFLNGFWITMVREWNGIDRLRMDKYYMLVRRFLNASFRLLMRTKWDSSALQEYTNTLTNTGGPLCPVDVRVPASLTFHLAEIYLDELEKALSTSASSTPAPILMLLSPFISLAAQTPMNTTYKHLEESLFKPLFFVLRPQTSNPQKQAQASSPRYPLIRSNACADVPCPPSPMPLDALREAVLQKMFTVASAADTKDPNRRKLYALYKTLVEYDDGDV